MGVIGAGDENLGAKRVKFENWKKRLGKSTPRFEAFVDS